MDVNEDDEVYSVWTDDPELRTPMSRNLTIVHPDFRLFITTRVGSGRPLPAVLIQRGLKLACESKTTYLSTMGQVFEASARSVNSWTSYWNTPFTNDIKVWCNIYENITYDGTVIIVILLLFFYISITTWNCFITIMTVIILNIMVIFYCRSYDHHHRDYHQQHQHCVLTCISIVLLTLYRVPCHDTPCMPWRTSIQPFIIVGSMARWLLPAPMNGEWTLYLPHQSNRTNTILVYSTISSLLTSYIQYSLGSC